MLPYLALVAFIAVIAVLSKGGDMHPAPLFVVFVTLLVFVGLRHHVGMDWNNYLIMIYRANQGGIVDSFSIAEPGYALILRFSGQMGWGVYGAYVIGTFIFLCGLFRYARSTPQPWLALLAAIPYLVIVVAMAAARQTIAIGILLWLSAEWNRASVLKRVVFIFLASAFHTSALVFLFLVFLDLKVSIIFKTLGAIVLSIVFLIVAERTGQVEYYDQSYVSGQTALTQSSGAFFHVLMNGVPALIALLFAAERRAQVLPDAYHRNLGLIAIALIPLSLVTSVAAGRMTLYLFPVLMRFVAVVPSIWGNRDTIVVLKTAIGCGCLGLTAFWLVFGNSVTAHQNYQNVLTVPTRELHLCCKT